MIGILRKKAWILAVFAIAIVLLTGAFKNSGEKPVYRSPETAAFSPDGKILAVNDLTYHKIYLVDPASASVGQEINLNGPGQDIVWLDQQHFLVSEYETGQVLKINALNGKTVRKYEAGPNAFHMAVYHDQLWIGLYGLNKLAIIDLRSGKKIDEVQLLSLPWDLEIAPSAGLALVTNLIPGKAANGKEAAASVTLIDLETRAKITEIGLPHGASNLRHLEVSADGKWAYAVHTRGKISLPTSQLERGWVNTNMLSILDLEKKDWYASVLLDKVRKGASDPWDVIEDSHTGNLLISLAGVHEIATVKVHRLHEYLRGEGVPANLQVSNANAYTSFDVWQQIKASPDQRVLLQDQISALHAAGLLEREKIGIRAPRGLDLSPDGNILAVTGYYSGELALKDLKSGEVKVISLGKQSEPDQVRRGEMAFHDATRTLENWLSCFSCHPDTRADGLNWDLLNDGIGNPKNTKSLVWTHLTPPSMSTGVRANYEVAVMKGFHFIKFYQGSEAEFDEVRAYLASLSPDESPWLKLTAKDKDFARSVERGKNLFASSECSNCHEPPLFTNKKMYDFGYADQQGITAYDVPTLRELWRTAPYWHDGSKASLKELLTDSRLVGVHGKTEKLQENDLDDLTNYLLTL